jgi:hypothetical protein
VSWSSPITPVSGTVITVAWATSSVVDPINWLRAMTGGADPPGSDYSITSVNTTGTTWVQKVSKAGDTMTSDLQINRSGLAAPTTGYLILGNATSYYVGFDGGKHVISTPRMDVQNDLYVYRAANAATGYVILGNDPAHYIGFDGTNIAADGSKVWTDANTGSAVVTAKIADANVTTSKIADANVTSAKLASAVSGALVPSGLIAAFGTASAIAAGWARFTSGNGKFLVGDGTSFGQSFSEGASAGSSWTHLHGTNPVTVQSGSGASAAAAANTLNATWIPPSFTVVWAQKS